MTPSNFLKIHLNIILPSTSWSSQWPSFIIIMNIKASVSYRGHGSLSVVSVVCCQVEVSATSWSLVQRSPTDCGVSLYVIYRPREWGGYGPLGVLAPNKKINERFLTSASIATRLWGGRQTKGPSQCRVTGFPGINPEACVTNTTGSLKVCRGVV